MKTFFERLPKWFLYLPIPLGLWLYHIIFLDTSYLNSLSSLDPYIWVPSLAIATILQSLALLSLARSHQRSLLTILTPTALLIW